MLGFEVRWRMLNHTAGRTSLRAEYGVPRTSYDVLRKSYGWESPGTRANHSLPRTPAPPHLRTSALPTPSRQVHPLQQRVEAWVGAQVVEARIDLRVDDVRVVVVRGAGQPDERRVEA